jgi:hypothetical protein
MTRLTALRLAIAACGIALFGWGARADEGRVRLAGIVVIALALALRLLPASVKQRIDQSASTDGGP